MNARRLALVLSWALTVALVSGVDAQRLVPTADPKYPRLKFADSLVTPNDRCIVSHSRLNPKVRPVYVNGVPIGFC